MTARWWTDERVERLRALLAEGKTYSQCAEILGKPRGSIATGVWRYIDGKPWKHGQKRKYVRKSDRAPERYTDDALTETWAERKARRARQSA